MWLWEPRAPDGAEHIVWKTKRFHLEFIIFINFEWKTFVTPNRLENQTILSSETGAGIHFISEYRMENLSNAKSSGIPDDSVQRDECFCSKCQVHVVGGTEIAESS